MSKTLRVRFIRGERVKYVSHLDLMRTFERATRRAELPIAYSQGFNPHPNMVFGLPLSVGVTSEGEYADFDISEDMEENEFLTRINSALPEGLIATNCKVHSEKSNIMKEIAGAAYDVLISTEEKLEASWLVSKIHELMKEDKILVIKESKGKKKEVDIKPMVYGIAVANGANIEYINFDNSCSFEAGNGDFVLKYIEAVRDSGWKTTYDVDNCLRFSIFCSAGSVANLKPELFVDALMQKSQREINIVKVHRTELFIKKGENMHLVKPI